MNVFKEATKAEIKLKNLRKRAVKAAERNAKVWAEKEQAFIDGLDVQVRAALRGAGVLSSSLGLTGTGGESFLKGKAPRC